MIYKLMWTQTSTKKQFKERAHQQKLTDYFVKPGSESEDAVTEAEGAFAFHTIKHRNSFKSMDCTSVLLKKTFPDSEVAQKFSSARTKTEAIVLSVLAPHSVDVVLKMFEENDVAYCGVATEEAIPGSGKIFPVIFQYFDWKNGSLQSKLIEVQNTPNESANTIAHYVKQTFEKNGLFETCIAFTGDNCNTMFGRLQHDEDGKNVFANFKKLLQKRTLIGVGCPAHILNNCVHHAAERMNVDIKNIIFKIYQYFHIYAVRTERLKEYFKGLLAQKRMEGIDEECDKFCAEADNMYSRCLEYLKKWLRPLEDFSCFRLITLSEAPNWSDVEPCIKYLINKGVQIDDVKCFDQVSNLKKFTESCNSDEEFSNLLAHQKWTKYFEKSKNTEYHSELLKIAQFFFAIPSHNANVE
ncbi:unnamed protein product [Caretta caretta]